MLLVTGSYFNLIVGVVIIKGQKTVRVSHNKVSEIVFRRVHPRAYIAVAQHSGGERNDERHFLGVSFFIYMIT